MKTKTYLENLWMHIQEMKRYAGTTGTPRVLSAYYEYVEEGGARRDKDLDKLLPLYIKKHLK